MMCDESVENATGKIQGSRKTSQRHLSSPGEGPYTGRRAVLINVASPGAEHGAQRAAHAHTASPALPGLQREEERGR